MTQKPAISCGIRHRGRGLRVSPPGREPVMGATGSFDLEQGFPIGWLLLPRKGMLW